MVKVFDKIGTQNCHVQELVSEVFETHCEMRLYMMKFHFLDLLPGNVSRFGAL